MTAPQFAPVDEPTADLLTLVRDEGHPSADHEWDLFVTALFSVAAHDGLVRPNDLRPLLRDRIAPRRVGAFVNAALHKGLISWDGESWQVSDDARGHNAGKPARIYRLTG